jgi:hypothetical protein
MSISTKVQGLWLFNNSLEEESLNNDFNISSGAPEYISYSKYDLLSNSTLTKYGLKLHDKYFVSTTDGGIDLQLYGSTCWIISFWWYTPSPVGYTRHVVTKDITSRVVPIFGIAETTVDAVNGTQLVDDGNGEIIISEVAYSSSQNMIRLQVCEDNNEPTHQFDSSSYSPGLHHVLISYFTDSSDLSVVKIFIDGKPSRFVGPYSNIASPTSAKAYLNYVYHGYTAHKYSHDGSFISELVVRQGYDYHDQYADLVFKFGYDSITDDSKDSTRYSYLGVSYDQTSTVTTNQIYSDGGNVYVTRSNGDILKGERPIWDNEFRYLTENSLSYLDVSRSGNVIVIPSGGIQVHGATIKI